MYDLYVSGRSCNVCISMLWLRVTSIIACDCWWFAHRFDAQNGRANHGACKIGPARHALELHHEPFRELLQRQVTKPYKTIQNHPQLRALSRDSFWCSVVQFSTHPQGLPLPERQMPSTWFSENRSVKRGFFMIFSPVYGMTFARSSRTNYSNYSSLSL